jgi:hypothetical protein
METKEIFKDIKGYEGLYQISNHGRVKRLPHFIDNGSNNGYIAKELILKPAISTYYSVVLSKGGKSKTFRVHQLVAIMFLNHNPCGYRLVVDHKDHNPLNNHMDNLQIVSNRYNSSKDKFRGNHASKFIGVWRNKSLNKWGARIRFNNRRYHLGYYIKEEDASNAYKEALSHINNPLKRAKIKHSRFFYEDIIKTYKAKCKELSKNKTFKI